MLRKCWWHLGFSVCLVLIAVKQIVCQFEMFDSWYWRDDVARYNITKKTEDFSRIAHGRIDNITFRRHLTNVESVEDLRGFDPDVAEHSCAKEIITIGCSKCIHSGGLLYLCQYEDCHDKEATCITGSWYNSENNNECNECFCLDGTTSFCYPYLCYGQEKKSHEMVALKGIVKDKSVETCTPGHEFIQGVISRCEGCKCQEDGRWSCWHEYKSCADIVPGLTSSECEAGTLWTDDSTCSVCYCLSGGQKMCGSGDNCSEISRPKLSCSNQKCAAECYNENKHTLGLCLEDECVCTPAYRRQRKSRFIGNIQ